MSAEATQTQAAALPANHIRSTFEVTDINEPWNRPHGQEVHVFEAGADTSLCGHVDADTHRTSLACEADHDLALTYDNQVCDHCNRSVRKRVREDGLTTGYDDLDTVLRAEPGDELTVETPDDTYTFTLDEAGFNINSVNASGFTGRPAPEGCEYWCEKIKVSVKPDGSVKVRHPYNLLEGRETTTGTIVTDTEAVLMTDGGAVGRDTTQNDGEPAYEQFQRGDVVTLSYTNRSNFQTVTHRGTVCKSNRGGTRVLLHDVRRRPLRNVRLECGRHVVANNREGNGWTKVVGDDAEIVKTGETQDVRYKHHTGWLVDEE